MVTGGPVLALDEERRAVQRLRWYMLLRWAGVAVLYSAGLASHEIGDLPYSLTAGNVLAPFVLAYNVVVWRLVVRWERTPPADWRRAYRVLGNVQCSLDLVVLAVAVHFAGGIESWGVIQPIAVLVVAGLVLPARDSLFQGILACALVNAVVIGEATGTLGHVDIDVLADGTFESARHVAAFVALYDAVVLFIVFLVVFIAQRLREREEELTRVYSREHETVRRLEELDRLKSDFLATVSHELRTPLTAILGFAKHLLHYWDRTGDALRLEQLAAIERQSTRLQRLVEGLLDFSAIEADNLGVQPDEVDVAEAVDAAVTTCQVPDVVVAVPPGVVAWADRHRVEQALVNLLDNAAKYGAPPIEVSAAVHDGRVVVSVSDGGRGLPAGAEDQVWDRFFQLDRGPTRTSTGVGLGLALVKGYVEAQGGTVWYEQAGPEGGARFRFSLPSNDGAQAGTNNGDS